MTKFKTEVELSVMALVYFEESVKFKLIGLKMEQQTLYYNQSSYENL